MKTLLPPMLAAASFATIVFCGASIAFSLNSPYRPHQFQHLNSSIWSDIPIRVDQGAQDFERLAVTPVLENRYKQIRAIEADHSEGQLKQSVLTTTVAQSGNELCQQRYRSYRSVDNTYQPFDGGPRRKCELVLPMPASEGPALGASTTVADSATSDHATWCHARYSSYDPADDTFQPFGGGARRTCQSPVSMASKD